jgi:PAS domain S-box-containing protein
LNEAADENGVVLAHLPAGPTQRRIAFGVSLALLAAGAIAVPFGRVQLPSSNAFAPIFNTFICFVDLITWFLLISEFNVVRSRGLLVLASGYLFAAAMAVPQLLTFPGVFTGTGLLGAGVQTTLWLGLWGLTGYPLAVIFYAVMKKEPEALVSHNSTRTAAAASVAVVIAIVLALTWIATAKESYLPTLLPSRSQSPTDLQYVGMLLLLLTAIALLLLWFRWRSVLDLWLMVAMCAWLAQGIATWIHTGGRFSLSFYAGRTLFAISSTVLLVVLLMQTMNLYVRLAASLVALRRLSAEKLQRSEAYLSEAQRLSHTGSFGWSLRSGQIYWSEETYNIFQYDRAVMPRLALVLQRVHPDDRALVQEAIDRASEAWANLDFEHRLLMPDGSVKYLHVLARASEPSSGTLEYFGAVTDVTPAKQAEETLRKSEAYLAEAQRLSHTGSWAWAPATGDISYWSEECYRVQGFDPYGGLPRFETFFQRVHPEDQPGTATKLERATREREEFEMDYRIVHPSGEVRDIHVVGHPVITSSGDLAEFVGTVIDVTERKRADEQRERLRQTQTDLAHINRVATMGELTASVAHEVNQPIAAAVTDANTCMRWLARDQPDLEEARAAAMRVVKDATRAAEIISRIRLLFNKGTPERELVDVNEIIGEMIFLLRSEAIRYNIAVRTELAADLPQVMADRVQLQQVLMNLMINGIDAMKDVEGARELAINSERADDERLLVSVSDTGVGLPPQQADQIFNTFVTTKPHGTGMGLPISRSIVESHGGRLWAAPNSPRGANFYFMLPLTPRYLNDEYR